MVGMGGDTMRNQTAKLLAPIMRATGFRFSKDYRWGTTLRHRMIYRCVNTVRANILAGHGDVLTDAR
jgi:hypothetical protein